jgi:cytochrome c peroxidase
MLTDGLSLAIGTGATGSGNTRAVGAGRQLVPRHAPSLVNQGLGFFYTLWDGRVNEEGQIGQFKSPPGIVFPAGLNNLLAAQGMLPILNRVEMRGNPGDVDRFGAPNEFANIPDTAPAQVWKAAMNRLLAIQEYAQKFAAAYPGVVPANLGFQHAANALSAFQVASFTRTNSAFDKYLARDDRALTDDQKRGGILFFGKAMCVTCHSGALLGGRNFANIGVPQIGPGVGGAAPLDIGRAENLPPNQGQFYRFSFRVPPLRNVELTSPYMHNGAYRTLEAVVRHYTNADSAQRNYDVTQLDPAARSLHHGDAATINEVNKTLDGRLQGRFIKLNAAEQAQIVAFLKSLTDPAAKSLPPAPASVPSGLPVKN